MVEAITCNISEELGRKVLHVFDHSFPIGDGYAYRSGEVIHFERRLGWKTIHLTSAKQGATQSAVESIDGLEFHRTQPSRYRLHSIPAMNQWGVVTTLGKRIAEIAGRKRPDILHVHSPCLNGIAALGVGRRMNLPIVYEMRSSWEDAAVDSGTCREGDLRYRLSRVLESYVCRKVNHVVTICDGLREDIISRGIAGNRVTVVPNSVDLARFMRIGIRDEVEATRLRLERGKTFGFIGTFFPFEGLDVLLRAVPAICARDPHVRFVLIGDGPEDAKLRSLVRELQIEDAVIFTGRVSHAEVDRYYDLIDVLVYPRVSKRITELVTPLKPLEAMAKRKIVVASDVGGHREMIFPEENGILFRAGDSSSLADACIYLLSHPEIWASLAEKGHQYVSEYRSWERNVLIYDQLYRSLLGKRSLE